MNLSKASIHLKSNSTCGVAFGKSGDSSDQFEVQVQLGLDRLEPLDHLAVVRNAVPLPDLDLVNRQGDVSLLMPTMQSYAGGASGRTHSNEFEITDWELDVVETGKALANTAISLLSNEAALGRKIIDGFDAPLTIPEYLATLREFRRTETFSA